MSGAPQMSVACGCGEQKHIRVDKVVLGDSTTWRFTCFRCFWVVEYSDATKRWTGRQVGREGVTHFTEAPNELPDPFTPREAIQ